MDNSKELVIITGVSGAGKSSAMAFMEDAGYYCIDNMPPELMSTFVGLLANNSEYYPKVAMVVDVRSGHVFEKIISSIDNVEQYGYTAKIVYLDINDTEALKRYKLTRRKHPFADKFNGNIQNALDYEREILAPLRLKANHIIDTSSIDTHQLRARLTELLLGDAKEYMNMGYYLGIGGVITFKNAKKLKEVVEYAPLDYLLLETDSPYLAPEPYRGKRNCSLYLNYVAEEIARIKKISYEEVVETTKKNAQKLFGVK